MAPPSRRNNVASLGMQGAYFVAHRMLRAYWFLRRPKTSGALIALWNAGELLLVKNSYRRHYTLPGGYIREDEPALVAASRELGEEVGVHVPPEHLHQAFVAVREFEFRHDRVTICELTVTQRPTIDVDHREVVWAEFVSPAKILERPVVPHLRDYLACHPLGRGR